MSEAKILEQLKMQFPNLQRKDFAKELHKLVVKTEIAWIGECDKDNAECFWDEIKTYAWMRPDAFLIEEL